MISEKSWGSDENCASIPVPYEVLGDALCFCCTIREADDLLNLASEPGPWSDAVVVTKTLWEEILVHRQWDLGEGVPEVLRRSLQFDPLRIVRLAPSPSVDIVSQLQTLESFRCLALEKTTDEFLDLLAQFQELEELELLWCYDITATGLASVAKCKNLRRLCVSWCQGIRDAELELLSECTSLEELFIGGSSKLTDVGVANLNKIANLRRLSFVRCGGLTDVAVLAIAQHHPYLNFLSLEGCPKLTDESVESLSGMRYLRELRLVLCNGLSDEAIRHLKMSLESCSVNVL